MHVKDGLERDEIMLRDFAFQPRCPDPPRDLISRLFQQGSDHSLSINAIYMEMD